MFRKGASCKISETWVLGSLSVFMRRVRNLAHSLFATYVFDLIIIRAAAWT